MLYRLGKLSFGTSQLVKLFDFNTDFIVSGICHVTDFGFLFVCRDNHLIGYVDYNGKIKLPWIGTPDKRRNNKRETNLFSYPSSICYHPISKRCFLIEEGGSAIRQIDVSARVCSDILMPKDFERYFSKTETLDRLETSCDISDLGALYWCVKNLHRCFMKRSEDNVMTNFIGDGASRFSTSHDLNHCSLSQPSSVKCIGKAIYIADESNHCVREISNSAVRVILGNPLSTDALTSPSQIKFNNKIMYVLDQQSIKYLSLNGKNTGVIYTSPNIVSIESSSTKDMYVLEKL